MNSIYFITTDNYMNYRKNEDGSYTAFRYMKFDGTMLEATAQDLDNAKALLKHEIEAHKTYALEEIGTFFSPGCENQKGIIYSKDAKVITVDKGKK